MLSNERERCTDLSVRLFWGYSGTVACLRACDFYLQLLLPLLQKVHHDLMQSEAEGKFQNRQLRC